MDRLLPAPVGAALPVRMPLLDGFEFAFNPGDYKKLAGLERIHEDGTRTNVTPRDIDTFATEDRASLVQAWLFFGLLSTFYGRDIRPRSFVTVSGTQEPHRSVSLDQSTMTTLMGDWTNDLRKLDAQGRIDRVADLAQLLDFASSQCDVFDELGHSIDKIGQDPKLRSLAIVALSVRLLIAYLHSSLTIASHEYHFGDSVAVMLRLVDTSRRDSRHDQGQRDNVFLPIPAGGKAPLSALILLGQFQENNWCPLRAYRLCSLYDYSVVQYLARVRRSDPEGITHEECEGHARCQAYDFDDSRKANYKPKHISRTCDCDSMQVDMATVASAISDGEIPILSMDPQAPDLDIRCERYNGITKYTAISHVWSDGLGNPHENSLPLCQLRRLAQTMTNIKARNERYMGRGEKFLSGVGYFKTKWDRRVYFWMDTLCVPVQVPKDFEHSVHEIKLRAIRHITPIFEAAEQILVLDAELEDLRLRSPDDDEMTAREVARDEETLTARILGSKWFQRAWTLEEGSLGRECLFKVAGDVETVALGELIPAEQIKKDAGRERKRKRFWKEKKKKAEALHRQSSKSDPEAATKIISRVSTVVEAIDDAVPPPHFETPLKLLLAGPLNENRKQAIRLGKGSDDAKRFATTRAAQFSDAWNDLLDRSSTQPHDSLVILANILDYDSGAVARIQPAERRLPAIIRSSHELPLGLLFNTGAKSVNFTAPKDSWIPTAIDGDRLTGPSIMTKTAEKLFRLDVSKCPASLMILRTQGKIPFDVQFVSVEVESDTGDGEQYIVEICRPSVKSSPDSWAQQLQGSYEKDAGDANILLIDFTAGSLSTNGYVARGACLNLLKENKKSTNVRYAASMTVWTSAQQQHLTDLDSKSWSNMRCTRLDPSCHLDLDHDVDETAPTLVQRPLLKPPSRHTALWRFLISYLIAITATSVVIEVFSTRCAASLDINSPNFLDNSNAPPYCSGIRGAVTVVNLIVLSFICLVIWRFWRKLSHRRWLRTFNRDSP